MKKKNKKGRKILWRYPSEIRLANTLQDIYSKPPALPEHNEQSLSELRCFFEQMEHTSKHLDTVAGHRYQVEQWLGVCDGYFRMKYDADDLNDEVDVTVETLLLAWYCEPMAHAHSDYMAFYDECWAIAAEKVNQPPVSVPEDLSESSSYAFTGDYDPKYAAELLIEHKLIERVSGSTSIYIDFDCFMQQTRRKTTRSKLYLTTAFRHYLKYQSLAHQHDLFNDLAIWCLRWLFDVLHARSEFRAKSSENLKQVRVLSSVYRKREQLKALNNRETDQPVQRYRSALGIIF